MQHPDGYWYDISKIPDLYDNIRYDNEHNPELCLNQEDKFERMYLCLKNVSDVLVCSTVPINTCRTSGRCPKNTA